MVVRPAAIADTWINFHVAATFLYRSLPSVACLSRLRDRSATGQGCRTTDAVSFCLVHRYTYTKRQRRCMVGTLAGVVALVAVLAALIALAAVRGGRGPTDTSWHTGDPSADALGTAEELALCSWGRYRLPTTVVPQQYNLTLEVSMEGEYPVEGMVAIDLEVLQVRWRYLLLWQLSRLLSHFACTTIVPQMCRCLQHAVIMLLLLCMCVPPVGPAINLADDWQHDGRLSFAWTCQLRLFARICLQIDPAAICIGTAGHPLCGAACRRHGDSGSAAGGCWQRGRESEGSGS